MLKHPQPSRLRVLCEYLFKRLRCEQCIAPGGQLRQTGGGKFALYSFGQWSETARELSFQQRHRSFFATLLAPM